MLSEQIVIDFPGDSPLSHKLLPKMAVFAQPLGFKRVSTEMILPSTWCRVEVSPSQVPMLSGPSSPPASSQADPVHLSPGTIKAYLLVIDGTGSPQGDGWLVLWCLQHTKSGYLCYLCLRFSCAAGRGSEFPSQCVTAKEKS